MDFTRPPMPGHGWPQGAQTSIVSEALFNRIHFLENQLAEARADRDAAHRIMYRLLEVECAAKLTGAAYSSSGPTNMSSADESSFDSSNSPQNPSQTQFVAADPLANHEKPLIDLLDPVDEPIKMHRKKGSLASTFRDHPKLDASDEDQHHVTASSYIRHFSKITEPTPTVSAVSNIVDEPPENVAMGPLKHLTSLNRAPFQEDPLYSSSSEEESPFASRYASLNTSFSDSPEAFEDQKRLIIAELRKHDVHLATRAAAPNPAFLNFLSPEQRWANFCMNPSINDENQDHCALVEDAAFKGRKFTNGFTSARPWNISAIAYKPLRVDQDTFRSVVISEIPSGVTMADILKEVRGGMILEAILGDTTSITGFKSAFLTFVEGNAAKAFEANAQRYGLKILHQQVHVSLIQTPTTPVTKKVRNGIRQADHTRCLDIQFFPRTITPQELRYSLRPDKASRCDHIESMAMNANGVLELRFTSIVAAEYAWSFFTARDINVRYQRCRIDYADDPCAQPWIVDETPSESADEENGLREHSANGSPSEQDHDDTKLTSDKALENFEMNLSDVDALVVGERNIEDTKTVDNSEGASPAAFTTEWW